MSKRNQQKKRKPILANMLHTFAGSYTEALGEDILKKIPTLYRIEQEHKQKTTCSSTKINNNLDSQEKKVTTVNRQLRTPSTIKVKRLESSSLISNESRKQLPKKIKIRRLSHIEPYSLSGNQTVESQQRETEGFSVGAVANIFVAGDEAPNVVGETESVIDFTGSVGEGGSIVSNAGSVVNAGSLVGEGGSMVCNAGSVVNAGSLVGEGGSMVSDAGSVVNAGSLVGEGDSVVSNAGSGDTSSVSDTCDVKRVEFKDGISDENDMVIDGMDFEEISSTNVVKVSVCDSTTYELEIRKSKKLMTLDEMFTTMIVPEFNSQKKQLKDSPYIIIKRRSLMVSENEFQWAYSCSCNPFNASIIESIDATNGIVGEIDLSFNACLHIKAVMPIIEEISNCEQAIGETSHNLVNEITQLSFDSSKLVVIHEGSVGVISMRLNQNYCFTCCSLYCEHLDYFKKQQELEADDLILKEYAECHAKEQKNNPSRVNHSVSTSRIKFETDKRGQFCLRNPISEYLPRSSSDPSIFVCKDTDITICSECSNQLESDENELEIVSLLTLNNCLSCEVYRKRCGACFKSFSYDGGNDLILNMDKVLIHHSVMRDYMFQFLHGNSCTLSSFYQKWQLTHLSAGSTDFKKLISPAFWRHSWYAYLKLLDFDLSDSATCPSCGNVPDTVVCDATSLGFQRKFATVALQEYDPDVSSAFPRYSDHNTRVAITSKSLRDSFSLFSSNRLNKTARRDFLVKLKLYNRSMYNTVKWVYDVYREDSVPKPFIDFFNCLSSCSPVCSYVLPSKYCCDLVLRLCDQGIKGDVELLRALQNDVPIFYNMLHTLTIESCLPEIFKGLLIYLSDLALAPFRAADEVRTKSSVADSNYARFPNLPKLRERGYFAQDKTSFKNPCRKFYTGHPRLLPGIFTVYCVHGICYGYQVMENQESPNIPFTIFRTRFPKAPKIIIYDNACGLHAYCLNRDPLFFQQTLFLVDRFHWKNHTGCSMGYNIKMYPQMKDVNSEVNEQQNASTKKLKTQLSYMNEENFLIHCDFFIWYRNYLKKSLKIYAK